MNSEIWYVSIIPTIIAGAFGILGSAIGSIATIYSMKIKKEKRIIQKAIDQLFANKMAVNEYVKILYNACKGFYE